MSKELAKAFAKRFIQRRDVKAIQLDRPGGGLSAGDWFPDTRINIEKRPNSPHLPVGFNMAHLLAHLSGERTYGHYLLDADSNCKLFVFDIDLEKSGTIVKQPNWESLPFEHYDNPAAQEEWYIENSVTEVVDGKGSTLRDLWMDRRREAAPSRAWLKYQMRHLSQIIASKVHEMNLPTAVAYSGSKGVHVYGFTGSLPAKEVREAAMIALDMSGEFEAVRGNNFFKHKNDDPFTGFANFSIEVFPKQDSLEGKSLGNLVRLPLGVNHKNPKDPTFFVDMTTPLAELKPHANPVKLLEEGNPFA